MCDVELHFAIFLANYDNNDYTQKIPHLLIVFSMGLKQLTIKGFVQLKCVNWVQTLALAFMS